MFDLAALSDPRGVYARALLLALFVALFLLAVVFAVGRALGRAESRREYERRLPGAREDAVKRSRAVLSGQIGEQLAPFLPDFPGNPDDARFLGKPLDFVIFDGLSEGAVREIVFVEVKSGGAALNANERSVRDAVRAGRVRWAEYRLP